MSDFERGLLVGLRFAIEIGGGLQKSPAFFVTFDEYEGYKKGVRDYKKEISEVLFLIGEARTEVK